MLLFRRHLGWTLAAIFVLSLLGCGPSGPKKYKVTGNVTWEGAAIPAGDILLTPTDGSIPDAGKIIDGKYELMATEGQKLVSVIAVREVGEVDPSMGAAPRRNYIPTRYNDQTTLNVEVTPAGPNQFDFALTSKESP